ncbi:hypothetical protein BDV96DRAFT_501539 [Lophiotrema nucula]|uniref:Autophagy-related protein 28 n=1 Tax=Lophiotrema nucula TaxID=690887 RepID=A0A6A5YT58_9PLEO|nr:hypothetical protein BDV96DRAFT_501539 [Lophiotrema nucula]
MSSSIFNSVLGSLSPKFRSSFEDPRGEHELPMYRTRSESPRVPPPIASTVMWNAPTTSLSPPPRVPDDLINIQRKARHLEHQLQELLDAQADRLVNGSTTEEQANDDLTSNGSITPTVSSVRGSDRAVDGYEDDAGTRKRKLGLNAARRGIFRRIQQLASVKAEELDFLDEDMRDIQKIVERAERWKRKRDGLQRRIQEIQGEETGTKTGALREEASRLEQEIRLKEEELWALKARHRRVVNDLADTENSVEASLASFKDSLSMLDKDVARFLARKPDTNHVPLSKSPFLSLPPNRRTLEMAREYWSEEQMRLAEKCEEADIERAALDEGAVLWNNIVKRVVDLEATVQKQVQRTDRDSVVDSKMLTQMNSTISYLQEKMDLATSRSWNLLVCAIGAELESLTQGKELLEQVLGPTMKGKEKSSEQLVDTESSTTESEDEASHSAIRITRSPPKSSAPPPKPKFFDIDDEDPDPELMILHQDTDTD